MVCLPVLLSPVRQALFAQAVDVSALLRSALSVADAHTSRPPVASRRQTAKTPEDHTFVVIAAPGAHARSNIQLPLFADHAVGEEGALARAGSFLGVNKASGLS